MRPEIKLMIVDDHPLVVQAFVATLAPYSHITLVGTASNGELFLNSVDKLKPDIVLMDIRMPMLNGIETTKKLSETGKKTKVICITGFEDEKDLMEMLRAGAKGFILKSSDTSEVVRAIDKVSAGDEYYCRNAMNIMIKRFIRDTPYMAEPLQFEGYTKKELQIIRLICKQKTSKEMSDELFLGEKTINYYRQRIIEKMQVRNTAGIVIYAIRNNMVNINELY